MNCSCITVGTTTRKRHVTQMYGQSADAVMVQWERTQSMMNFVKVQLKVSTEPKYLQYCQVWNIL